MSPNPLVYNTATAPPPPNNYPQLFEVTGAALRVGFPANRDTLLRILTVVAEVADLTGELTFGTVR